MLGFVDDARHIRNLYTFYFLYNIFANIPAKTNKQTKMSVITDINEKANTWLE